MDVDATVAAIEAKLEGFENKVENIRDTVVEFVSDPANKDLLVNLATAALVEYLTYKIGAKWLMKHTGLGRKAAVRFLIKAGCGFRLAANIQSNYREERLKKKVENLQVFEAVTRIRKAMDEAEKKKKKDI